MNIFLNSEMPFICFVQFGRRVSKWNILYTEYSSSQTNFTRRCCCCCRASRCCKKKSPKLVKGQDWTFLDLEAKWENHGEKLNHNKYIQFWSNLSKRESHPTSPPNNGNSSFYKSLTMDFFRKMAETIPAPLPRTTRKNSCDSVIQMTFWKLLRFLLFF